MNIKHLASACVLAFAAQLAQAQQPSDASIHELLQVSKADQQLRDIQGTMERVVMPMFRQQMPTQATPRQREVMERFMKDMIALMAEEFKPEQTAPLLTKVYKDVYTQDDVDGMIAFYRTPAGQSMLSKTPMVAAKTMEHMQGVMVRMQARMRPLAERMAEELKAAR